MKNRIFASLIFPMLLFLGGLFLTGCQFLKTPEGQNFIQGRAQTAAYVLAMEEGADVVDDVERAARIVLAFAESTETISVGALTAALEEAGLDSAYAPVIVSEVVGLYELAMSQTDIGENELYVASKVTLASISSGLLEGIKQWRIYVEATE